MYISFFSAYAEDNLRQSMGGVNANPDVAFHHILGGDVAGLQITKEFYLLDILKLPETLFLIPGNHDSELK